MAQIPAACSKETLLALLDDIRHHVEHDDSFEGYLQYTMPWAAEMGDPETDGPEVRFRVTAGYRIGNRQGQGGFRTIGTIE
jgi:hypothetical protein